MSDPRIVSGVVDPKGIVLSGSGFRCQRIDTGLYILFFDQTFNALPAVLATQSYPFNMNDDGGNTRDNAVVVGIAEDRTKIKTGNENGTASDRYFSFAAIGV